MKLTIAMLAVCALSFATWVPSPEPVAVAAQPPADPQPDPRAKDAEPLPEAPKLDPKNQLIPLNKQGTYFAEKTPEGKIVRIMVACEVCLREGPLEVFVCKKNTKEHEAVLRVDVDAKLLHAGLLAAGAARGKPTQFVDPKTNEAKYGPATGTKIKVDVHYKKDGKLHTHSGQEWIWNSQTKKPLDTHWVFAGSVEIKDPMNPDAEPYYASNSGEVITISNFTYAMLDVPIEISKDDAALNYEAKTEKIPPLFSKVWLILEPVPEKK